MNIFVFIKKKELIGQHRILKTCDNLSSNSISILAGAYYYYCSKIINIHGRYRIHKFDTS